jgi:head-tail adaptor
MFLASELAEFRSVSKRAQYTDVLRPQKQTTTTNPVGEEITTWTEGEPFKGLVITEEGKERVRNGRLESSAGVAVRMSASDAEDIDLSPESRLTFEGFRRYELLVHEEPRELGGGYVEVTATNVGAYEGGN